MPATRVAPKVGWWALPKEGRKEKKEEQEEQEKQCFLLPRLS
jgi:hypothetical protein